MSRNSLKHELNKEHIANRAAGNRKKHLLPPEVEKNDYYNRYQFRQTVTSRENINTFKAIDNQHCEYRRRQSLAEIFDKFRCLTLLRLKNGERKKSCNNGSYCRNCYRYNLLSNCHSSPPPFSIGLRSAVSRKSMRSIVGIINESEPKRRRQTIEAKRPISEV